MEPWYLVLEIEICEELVVFFICKNKYLAYKFQGYYILHILNRVRPTLLGRPLGRVRFMV